MDMVRGQDKCDWSIILLLKLKMMEPIRIINQNKIKITKTLKLYKIIG